MRDQRVDVDFALGEQLKKSFHVARFGPSNIADRIISALLLVSCVVAAGAVRTRDAELEFLLVIKLALDVHSDCAHGNNCSMIASDFCGQVYGIAAGSFRGNQYGIHTISARLPETEVEEVGCRRNNSICAEASCQLSALGRDVHTEDSATRRFQDLRRQLPEQSESDHGDNVAEFDLGNANPMQRNCAHGGKGGFLESDWRVESKFCHQKPWHTSELCVNRISSTSAGDAISDKNVGHARPDREHRTRAAVAKSS